MGTEKDPEFLLIVAILAVVVFLIMLKHMPIESETVSGHPIWFIGR